MNPILGDNLPFRLLCVLGSIVPQAPLPIMRREALGAVVAILIATSLGVSYLAGGGGRSQTATVTSLLTTTTISTSLPTSTTLVTTSSALPASTTSNSQSTSSATAITHFLNCTVNLSGLQFFQNQTSSIDLLSRDGFSLNSSAYLTIEPLNITKIDVQMTEEPAFQQTVSGYVWVRAGWVPYVTVTVNSSRWSAYFPYSYPPTHAQDSVAPRGVYFQYEVYTHGGQWMGSFIGAYDMRYGNSSFSVFSPHPQCPIAP